MRLISIKINAKQTTCYRCKYIQTITKPIFLKTTTKETYYSSLHCSLFLPDVPLRLNGKGNPMRNEICLNLDSGDILIIDS